MAWTSDNVTEVTITALWTNSRLMDNVLHVRREEDDPAQSARDVLNNWQDHIVPGQANNYVLQGARYVDHNDTTGATGFILPDPAKPVSGTVTGQSATPQCCILIKKLIEGHVGSRSGRIYLPPPQEADVDENGMLTSGLVTTYNTVLATFLSGLSGPGDNELVVVHKRVAPTASPVSLVTGLSCDPLTATQRRRLRR